MLKSMSFEVSEVDITHEPPKRSGFAAAMQIDTQLPAHLPSTHNVDGEPDNCCKRWII